MGAQNAKQIQGQSPVQIDHPKFQNAKVFQDKNTIFMSTVMGIEEKDYQRWKQQLSHVKLSPDYLLIPKQQQFSSKGFCGSTGTLNVVYEYFPYLLIEQIQNRKKRMSRFQQCQLWFLLFSLSAAQIEMKKIFDSKVGDIRPQNVFISQQGEIKVSCLNSWPKQTSNFQKTFEHQQTLLAPEDMNKLELGGMDDLKNYQSEIFSIGMTILSAALLTDFNNVYDVKKFKFKYDEANQYLQEWRANTIYSQIFTAFVSNLCSFEPQTRLTEKELWSWINKYEEQIKNKDDFVIEHAPLKIQKQIQELRGQSNINMLQETVSKPVGVIGHTLPFQDRSVVYPFTQHTDPRFINQHPQIPPIQGIPRQVIPQNQPFQMNHQHNAVLSPRDIHYQNLQPINESVHHNIQVAQSMYTQIPQEIYHKQFTNLPSNLPPGVIMSRPGQINGTQKVMSPSSQLPPGMSPHNFGQNLNNGNFVYTRRIIDPNSNSVVAQQRIGQQQYHRGIVEDRNQQSYE